MAFTSAKMGLKIWNLLTDLYDHTQLADNWARVDYHDHSSGKGVQIPTEGIADAAITGPKLASNLDPSAAYTSPRVLFRASATLGKTSTSTITLVTDTSGGTVSPPSFLNGISFDFDPTLYTASSRAVRCLLRATVMTGGTAPAVNYTFTLNSVNGMTAAASTAQPGSTGVTVIAASSVAVNVPPLQAITQASVEFDAPAAGLYVLNAVPSAAPLAAVTVNATLFVKQV